MALACAIEPLKLEMKCPIRDISDMKAVKQDSSQNTKRQLFGTVLRMVNTYGKLYIEISGHQ